ncbi:hypothetical protein [Hanstruepera marina]|uniref:hypothetical protein n=1 Tax=Hanstruepera marina TaxID=2873265 RepID=UPI001CA685B5|nr:hypothetical protein [Hanstruepera marina]
MPNNKSVLIVYLFLLGLFQFGFSQSNNLNSEKVYYVAFDSIIGIENTELYNGKRYVDRFRSSKENHRFYKDFTFVNGYVVYNNQPYYNLNLKYDLFEGVLITKLKGDKKFFNMVFITNDVQEFKIHDSRFVNINNYINSKDFTGFAELLYEGEHIVVLKKHDKKKTDKIKEQSVIYEFKPITSFIVTNRTTIATIKSKKDFKSIFPDKMEAVNTFYKNNKSLNKSNPDLFITRLSELINNLN